MRRLAAVIATAALMLTAVPAGAEAPVESEDRRVCVYYYDLIGQCVVIPSESLSL